MNALTWIFIVLLAASVGLELWLNDRQRRHLQRHAREVPAAFSQDITPEAHARAAAYALARMAPSTLASLSGAFVLLLWTLGGALDGLAGGLAGTGLTAFWQGVALIAIVMMVSAVLDLPLDIWRTFGIEARFGFNRTTPGRFVLDRLLGLVVAVLLGGPLLIGALWLMESLPGYWWLAVWALWMAFSLFVAWVFPRVIAPLFNRFTPLDDDSLRQRLEGLLARCGFSSRGIFVMDGSRRSAHGNAYFTGLGRNKRIVFFDTLMSQLEPAELEAVLAHELGHFRGRHVQKALAMTAILSFAGLALLGWMADQDWFYDAFRVSHPGPAMALVLFMMVAPVAGAFLGPLFARISRRHEFEADAFAAAHAEASMLVRGLVKLYRDNAVALVADPLYAAFHFSHPAPAERVARLSPAAGAP